MKAYILFRTVQVPAPPVLGVYSDGKVAAEKEKEAADWFRQIMQGRIVMPQGGGQAADTGYDVRRFVTEALGVHSIAHPRGEYEVRDSNLVVPNKKLILPH